MAIDVFTANYKIVLNSKEINHDFVKSVNFTDEIDNSTDSVTVETTAEFARPSAGDELKLWLGRDEELVFMGSFHIGETTVTNRKLSFKATGANFSNNLKSRKNRAWEKVTFCSMLAKIAGEHALKNKCDVSGFVEHEAQSHESDLSFLKRIAKENNLTFSVKNGTLIFLKKEEASAVFECDFKKAKETSIIITNKTKYDKASATYRDSSSNKKETVTVGSGDTVLELQGSFKSKTKAKEWAKRKLETAKRKEVRGSVSITFNVNVLAGGKIKVINSRYDDGEYKVKRVTHNVTGGVTRVEFEG